MQVCIWGAGDSLESTPVANVSPRKLELLERRITGTSNPPRTDSSISGDKQPEPALLSSPASKMVSILPVTAAAGPHGSDPEVIVIPDTQEEAVIPADLQATTQPAVVGTERRSPSLSASEVPMSASKRRKTGKPQHRPVEPVTDHKNALMPSGASNGAVKDTVQRDKPVKARVSPRVKSEGAAAGPGASAGEAVPGNSNPPMSPPPTGT